MSAANIEERVEALETQFAEVLQVIRGRPPRDAWRKVVGLFAEDPQIEALHQEVARIREEDRAATRGGG